MSEATTITEPVVAIDYRELRRRMTTCINRTIRETHPALPETLYACLLHAGSEEEIPLMIDALRRNRPEIF